jgi:hypothetical protein
MMVAVRKSLAMVAMSSSTTLCLKCWTKRSNGEKVWEGGLACR